MSDTPLVQLKDISISFGGIRAVDHVSLDLHAGEVVGLLGHNGAGKSTLIKILAGAYKKDSGEIWIEGKRAEINSPRDARDHNIETIYQTLALADNLDAASNLFLGRELTSPMGFVDDAKMAAETIARAVYFNAKILIMDEPTAALGVHETEMVADLIKELKDQGLGIFLISHDTREMMDLCDRVSVMKNGQMVGTERVEDVTEDDILSMIIMGKNPRAAA
jgi:D-xylose transport system ATP-binding protein